MSLTVYPDPTDPSNMDGFDPVIIFGVMTYDIWFCSLYGAYHSLWMLRGSQFPATTVTNSLVLFLDPPTLEVGPID